MSIPRQKSNEFDPCDPPFDQGPKGHVAVIEVEACEEGEVDLGARYKVEVRFAPAFFCCEPSRAWSPDLVAVSALGFRPQDHTAFTKAGLSEEDAEREVLDRVQREPWIALEGALVDAMSEAQRTWLQEMGIEQALAGSAVYARFAKAFKAHPLRPIGKKTLA